MAINHSRYTMDLIKILITTTSPLCILEKEKLQLFGKHIQNLLDDYKRTLEENIRRHKKKNSIPSMTIIHDWLQTVRSTNMN